MNKNTQCDNCGRPFEPKANLAFQCPSCLLLCAFSEIDNQSLATEISAFEPPTIDALQPSLEQYELLALIGRGGMSAVYKARQLELDRIVAVKILPTVVADSVGGKVRFRREAKSLARFSHPNIVAIHEFGRAKDWCYFVMEYVDGCTLRQIMGNGDLESAEVVRIAENICDGIHYAHEQGFVHRDIKPENILIDKTGRVKVADFGLAIHVEPQSRYSRVTAAGQVVGTPQYLAPEQLRASHVVDRRADIYSLGVVMYELLTGELPIGSFELPSRKSGRDPIWDSVVSRALSANTVSRFGTALELKGALTNNTETQIDGLSGAQIADGGDLRKSATAAPKSPPEQILHSAAYCLYGLAALLMASIPALFTLLYAVIPVVSSAPPRNWDVMGYDFRPPDSYSITHKYWLASFGLAFILSGIWSILLSVTLTVFYKTMTRLLQPLKSTEIKLLRLVFWLLALSVMVPLGGVLLLIADHIR
ncbi:MAG: hypothetical protein Aurels2KO_56130 [Aureliella sp.]